MLRGLMLILHKDAEVRDHLGVALLRKFLLKPLLRQSVAAKGELVLLLSLICQLGQLQPSPHDHSLSLLGLKYLLYKLHVHEALGLDYLVQIHIPEHPLGLLIHHHLNTSLALV